MLADMVDYAKCGHDNIDRLAEVMDNPLLAQQMAKALPQLPDELRERVGVLMKVTSHDGTYCTRHLNDDGTPAEESSGAFLKGRVTGGYMLYNGVLRSIPHAVHGGRLEALFCRHGGLFLPAPVEAMSRLYRKQPARWRWQDAAPGPRHDIILREMLREYVLMFGYNAEDVYVLPLDKSGD